jgi:hypothetical protein
VPLFGRAYVWPADLDLGDATSLVQDLAATGAWLEQETVVSDERQGAALGVALEEVVEVG